MGTFDAIILTGGRSSRMGSPKQRLRYAGATLLHRAYAACTGARALVVAGPLEPDSPAGMRFAPEDPPFGGPVAGIASGLLAIDDPAEWVLVLAVDHPELPAAVPALLGAASGLTDDIDSVLVDHGGRTQTLLGMHRQRSLRRAVQDLDQIRDASVRQLFSPLRTHTIELAGIDLSDVDEPPDADRFGIALPPH
ncbi:molybdenum cofactor guanylyltransferase [Naumannella sp. ID2617S]|nr:molybdenum cofactor guanylyltransferase [Naumannella sp. ID2617S]